MGDIETVGRRRQYSVHHMANELAPGAIFARDFRIIQPLRAGGMGAVYIVEQLSTGKQRALKVMIPELAQNADIRERFVREARIASNIESDHLVEIVTAGVDEQSNSLYLVMELLRGEELADAAARTGALPVGDVAEVLSQVGHALEQAHMQGLVHRDLKPENIFLATSKRQSGAFTAKLLDFGIAKLVEDGRQKTGTQPLGSPLYMAPEQTDRKGRICPATDVWALGLMAFALLTGKSYWREAEEGSLASLLREICVDPLAPASVRAQEIGATLPAGFDAWFGRCVNRDIDARFVAAGEAVRAFSALVPHGVVERKLVAQTATFPTGPIGTANTGASSKGQSDPFGPTYASGLVPRMSATPMGAEASMGRASGGGSTAIWVGIAAVALGAAGVGGFLAFRAKKTPSATASSVSAASLPASAAPSASPVAVLAAGTCPEGTILHPAGSMIMGAKDGSDDSRPTHKVTLGAFCLDKTEVTASAYEQCVGASDCEKPPMDVSYPGVTPESKAKFRELCTARKPELGKHPINCVDWKMADAYCHWKKGRLPTEAEWEFAARGTSQRDFPWGDQAPSEKLLNACGAECMAWGKNNAMDMKEMFTGDDGFAATAPVGTYPAGASALGVLDLAGNVWEWTADWYAPYADGAETDPKGPASGTERVVRGGAFNGFMTDWAKPSYRWRSVPDTYNHAIGFRCAIDPQK